MSYSSGSTKSSPRTATATPCSDLVVGVQTSDYGSSDSGLVQQCVRCLHYGHDRCRRRPRCFRCGAFDHTNASKCVNPVVCLNCSGPHCSKHTGCPSRLRELTIQQLVHKQGLTRKEAVQMAASFGVDTSRLKSVAVQTDPPPADAATQTEFPETITARNFSTARNSSSSSSNINNNIDNHRNSCGASCTSTCCAHDVDSWKLSMYQTVPPPPLLSCWSTSYPTAPYQPLYPVQIVPYPTSSASLLASQVHWSCDQLTATSAMNEYYTSY